MTDTMLPDDPRQALASGRPLHEIKALVVEDDAILANVVDDMLRELGFVDIAHASSVEAALAALDKDQPHFVLLDANLRGAHAHPVARALREAGVPVIVTTGYSPNDLPPSLAAETILHKPFNTNALMQRIRDVLQRAEQVA
jgi:DNA-binding response OmpR family regulator